MVLLHAVRATSNGYDPFRELATAIVKQAAEDYRALGKQLNACADLSEERKIGDQMKNLSRFFLGEWCYQLTGSDAGPQILELLDKEVFGE